MEKIISKEQYLNLCKICDTFLTSKKVSLARVANPYFSVKKEHPLYLDKYGALFNEKQSKFNFSSSSFPFIRKIIKIFKILISFKSWYCKQIQFSKYDYIFLTHLINEKLIDNTEDSYFGSIPKELVKKNKKVLVVYINHTTKSSSKIKCNNKIFSQIILSSYLNFFLEFNFILMAVKDNLLLRTLLKKEKDELTKKIIFDASSLKFITNTIANLRVGEQLKRIVKKYQPKAIITTFEGNPIERIVYRMSREALNSIYCIAYLHVGLTQYQHSIKRKLSNSYDPDHIMTASKISYNQIIMI